MMTQKSIVDEVRKKTQKAKRSEEEVKHNSRQDALRAKEKVFAEVKANIKELFEKEFLPKIEEAAEKALSEVDLPVDDFPGKAINPTIRTQAMLEHGIAYLRQCGFTAEEKFDYSPRVGSDDDYGDRTFVSIHVSW